MASAYYRFFPGDYYRKTKHLSILQHGAYRMLIDEYMDRWGPLPNDLELLCRTMRATSPEEKNAIEYVLGDFFLLKNGQWTHDRCDEELKYAADRSEKAKESVRRREEKRSSNDDRTINGRSSIQSQSQNQNQRSKPSSGSSQKAAPKPDVRYPDQWDFKTAPKVGHEAEYILAFFNKVTGSQYRAVESTLRLIRARLTEHKVQSMKYMIVNQLQKWEGDERMEKFIRPQTFFNATNCQSYIEAARKAYEGNEA